MSDLATPPSVESTPESQPTPPVRSRRKLVLIIVAAVVVFVLAFVLVRWGLSVAFSGPSKQATIDKSVSQIKEQSDLPKQVDQVTTWTDVKAEPDAIHYEYTVASSVDPSSVTEAAIRNAVLPTLCSTASTRRILDEDIAMRYTYAFSGSTKTIDTTITKADC
jgi:hypothetical protein